MKKIKTNFKDLIIFENKSFKDKRGYFKELYKENFLKTKFIFQVMSFSKKNVIRGLHIQKKNPQGKFISVLKGAIFDVVVDLRKNSKTFGDHFKIILSEKNAKSILIPSGLAHGFLGLDKENIVLYSNNNYRSKNSETGLLWSDKDLKIKWPKGKYIISKKDKNNLSMAEFCKKIKFK